MTGYQTQGEALAKCSLGTHRHLKFVNKARWWSSFNIEVQRDQTPKGRTGKETTYGAAWARSMSSHLHRKTLVVRILNCL